MNSARCAGDVVVALCRVGLDTTVLGNSRCSGLGIVVQPGGRIGRTYEDALLFS
jgi:hypothetical protein